MNQKRQPKGTSDGGKFAPDVNSESTIDLAPEPILAMVVDSTPSTKYHCDNCDEVSFEEVHDCGATCREIDPSDAEDMGLNDNDEPETSPSIFTIAERESIIRRIEGEVDEIYDVKIEREPGGGDTLDQLIEDGDAIVSLKNAVIHHQERIIAEQRRELEALRKDAGGFNLDRAIFDNVCATIEIRREHVLGETSNEDVYEKARLTNPEIEQVRTLVDAHLENGISRGGDKAIGYLIEEESEYCMSEIESKLGDILKEDE